MVRLLGSLAIRSSRCGGVCSSCAPSSTTGPPHLAPATDETDDFDPISFSQHAPFELLTVHNLQIDLHGNTVETNLQLTEQVSDRALTGHHSRLTVELDLHRYGSTSFAISGSLPFHCSRHPRGGLNRLSINSPGTPRPHRLLIL